MQAATDTETGSKWPLLAAGVLLVGLGLRLRSGPGLIVALMGCATIWSLEGNQSRKRVRHRLQTIGAGVTSGIYDHVAQAAKEERHPAGTDIDDIVEEASDDSFPCSDPPSWTAR